MALTVEHCVLRSRGFVTRLPCEIYYFSRVCRDSEIIYAVGSSAKQHTPMELE